jgi:hypothetical protein
MPRQGALTASLVLEPRHTQRACLSAIDASGRPDR